MKVAGIVLLILGLGLTIFTSAKYFTKEKIIDIGPVQVTADKPHTYNWSPVIGIVLMGIGGIVLWQGSKRK